MDVYQSLTVGMILDYIDIGTDAIAAQDDDFTMNIVLTDTGENLLVKRKAGVLLVYDDYTLEKADCTLTCTMQNMLGFMTKSEDALKGATVEGDGTVPERLTKYMTTFTRDFNIIEP